MEHLIPAAWFQEIGPNSVLLLVLAGAVAVLGKGADWLVDGAASLALGLGVGKVIVGATIVSLGTTSPEAAVSVLAAWEGKPDLALGNAVGSVICDTGLIFGLCCLLAPLPMDRFVLARHGWIQFGSGVLLVTCALVARYVAPENPVLPRWLGVGLLGLLAAYLAGSIYWARGQRLAELPLEIPEALTGRPARDIGWMLVGLAVVLVSSRVLVVTASELAIRWSVPPSIVAATIVAFGTSLPELVTCLVAIRKKHPEIVVGNILGADILNVLFVVGASATAVSLAVEPIFYSLHFPAMMVVLVLFRSFASMPRETFPRWAGVPLLASYVAFLMLQAAF